MDFEQYPEEHCVKAPELLKEIDSDFSFTVAEQSKSGGIVWEDIENCLQDNTYLVIVNHISNVNGDIADLKKIGNELKKRNIKNVKVVYSKEEPVEAKGRTLEGSEVENMGRRKSIPGSCAFVPSVAGLILAGEVIKDLAVRNEQQ